MTARKKAIRNSKPAADEALMTDCVLFARWMTGDEGGLEADPSGSDEVSKKLPSFWRKSRKALARITATKATTASGLQAKALIVPHVLPNNDSTLNDDEFEFLRSFAENVKEFLEGPVRSEWLEKRAAEKTEKAAA